MCVCVCVCVCVFVCVVMYLCVLMGGDVVRERCYVFDRERGSACLCIRMLYYKLRTIGIYICTDAYECLTVLHYIMLHIL